MISTILILDDSAFQRKYLKNLLHDKFSLFEAEDISQAQRIYQTEKVDLILVDHILEKGNGYQFTEMLRKDKDYGNIPVIMISASDKPADVKLGFESGVNGYLTKPASQEKLYEMIEMLETEKKEKRKELILIIDDSKMIRSILKRALNSAGFSTVEAENGKEGYEVALRYRPDIITCDLEMPVMDGLEFVRTYRKHLDLFHIPIYMITTRVDEDLKSKAFELGISQYLTKPFDPIQIAALFSQKLDTKYRNEKKAEVLLVDDSKSALHIAEHTLSSNGYLTHTANDGFTALELLNKKRYDIVISDYFMPAMDGLTLLKKMKETTYNQNTPVVILSSAEKKRLAVDALQNGAADYITKPYEDDELIARIANILKRK